jgi:23S rRNA pseudouridine1911/1915/1917 synthase
MEPTLIYEDESIIVVNKPAGIMVHEDGVHAYPTLVDWLIKKFPELRGVGEPQTLTNGTEIERPGIVHRLDRETSGVLVVARTQQAFDALKEQFQNREVRKTYRAFVYGGLKDERGIIDKPIGSARGGLGPRSAKLPHGQLRDAVTVYRVLAHGAGASYVDVFPKTGRTHQIRVHFAAIQHPVVGDRMYASRRPAILGFSRVALHAHALSFTHPQTGEPVQFESPLPADFVAAEAALRKG